MDKSRDRRPAVDFTAKVRDKADLIKNNLVMKNAKGILFRMEHGMSWGETEE